MLVAVKRIYEKPSITDGTRVLVDRLWPRGVKRSTSNIDVWMKDIAPSDELRRWFNHDPRKWESFKKKYWKELDGGKPLSRFVALITIQDITILYASEDPKHNNAVALAEFVKEKL